MVDADGADVGRGVPGVVEVVAKAKRRTHTAQYKLAMVEEYDAADVLGKGALLRREGLYTSHISQWRRARDRGALAGLAAKRGPKGATVEQRRIAGLEAEARKLQAELDTARAVIRVQGELAALLEQLSTSSAMPGSESVDGK